MKAYQYTVRNVPPQIDRVLRKKAMLTGKSLNQTILEELAVQTGASLNDSSPNLSQELAWFIGSGPLDDQTLEALADDDKAQKELAAKQNGFTT